MRFCDRSGKAGICRSRLLAEARLKPPDLKYFGPAEEIGTARNKYSGHSRASGNPVPSQNAGVDAVKRMLRSDWVPAFAGTTG